MSNNRYDIALRDTQTHVSDAKLLYVTTAKYGGDWHSTLHAHDFSELFYVAGGKGQFQIQSQLFPVAGGDLVIINPHVEHTEISLEANPLEYIAIGVEGLELTLSENRDCPYSVVSFQNSVVDIQYYLNSMLREIAVKAPGYEMVCQNLMGILLIQLMRHSDFTTQLSAPASHINRNVAAARRYIEAHFRENLTLEQLAGEIHISKFHLAHDFSREYGFSPMQYLQTLRIQESRELLRTTDYSLTQIARMAGFSSPSYFAQRFRKSEGLTPSQYRARNR